jgi:molybdopterin converting factor small subunit
MKIYVKLYATLRQYVPRAATLTSGDGLDVADGTTLAQIMATLSLPESLKVLALVNGLHCKEKERVLADGDSLLFYPLMSGG